MAITSRIHLSTSMLQPAADFSPTTLFEFFFNNDVVETITRENKLHAVQKRSQDFTVSVGDLRLFFDNLVHQWICATAMVQIILEI